MARVKVTTSPSFLASALARIERMAPGILERAIKAAMEPPAMTFAKYRGTGYLMFDKALTKPEREAIKRAWPLYLAEHGEPPHLSRLHLVGPSELALVEPE